MTEQDVLHRPFDVKIHKETFTNYFEVVIGPDGVVEYAVPSHTEKLIRILSLQMIATRREVLDACPREFMGAFIDWLTLKSGYISVWEKFYTGLPSPAQIETLKMLQREGVYHGSVGHSGQFAEYGGGFRDLTETERILIGNKQQRS